MTKSRLWIVLSLVLVFAAGVAAGIFAERSWLGRHPSPPAGGRGHAPSHDSWAKELGLTEEQKALIQDVFKKNDERIKGLRTDFYKHLGEIRGELKKEIDAILTPEQRAKQEAMMQKYLEERRKDNARRDPGPKPRPEGNTTNERNYEEENHPRSGDPGDHRGSHPGLFPY
jgi:Spy/CpxP family protein refolding chaperone